MSRKIQREIVLETHRAITDGAAPPSPRWVDRIIDSVLARRWSWRLAAAHHQRKEQHHQQRSGHGVHRTEPHGFFSSGPAAHCAHRPLRRRATNSAR